MEEAAARVAGQVERDVQRPARRLQDAGRPVEGDHDAERQGGRRRALALQGGAQRLVERRQRGGGGDLAQVAHDRVVGGGVLADEAEQGERQQHGREQRHQRVVGERRGVMGHLVVVERDQRALDDGAYAHRWLIRPRGASARRRRAWRRRWLAAAPAASLAVGAAAVQTCLVEREPLAPVAGVLRRSLSWSCIAVHGSGRRSSAGARAARWIRRPRSGPIRSRRSSPGPLTLGWK